MVLIGLLQPGGALMQAISSNVLACGSLSDLTVGEDPCMGLDRPLGLGNRTSDVICRVNSDNDLPPTTGGQHGTF